MSWLPQNSKELHELRRTSRLWGLQADYTSALKETTPSSPEALVALLEILSGESLKGVEDLKKINRLVWQKKVSRGLEPVNVIQADSNFSLRMYVPSQVQDQPIDLEDYSILIRHEQGSMGRVLADRIHVEGEIECEGVRYLRLKLKFTARLPVGYHRITVHLGREYEGLLFAAPAKLKANSAKRWGLFTPLYSVKNDRNWGAGDLTDLEQLQAYTKEKGGEFVGTLPLLSLHRGDPPLDPSPYAPVSRLFWNELYLDIEELYKEENLNLALDKTELQLLRDSNLVQYDQLMSLKQRHLKKLAESFFAHKASESKEFSEFLENTAFINEYADFRSQGETSVYRMHIYSQFKLHQKLSRQKEKVKAGECAGLYMDFPVGVQKQGFDATHFKSSFLNEARAGAPPDLVFQGGQDWGFSPLHPERAREDGYTYLIQCLRRQMRYAQILRVDHVMGFHRIYAIPEGLDSKHGAYIRFKTNELFAILKIEASRAGVEVVGEDLGTVPEAVREEMSRGGLYRMWILPFELEAELEDGFAKIPEDSLASLNTHDMIPFAGYEQGLDLKQYADLKLLEVQKANADLKVRDSYLSQWRIQLEQDIGKSLFKALTEKVAGSPAKLLLVNLEDLWGETEAQNVPGTWRQVPNWRRKWRLSYKQWSENQKIEEFLESIHRLRLGYSTGLKSKPVPKEGGEEECNIKTL